MGHQGRFGKYGETKRFTRLRQSGLRQLVSLTHESGPGPFKATKMGSYHPDIQIREGLYSDERFVRRLSARVFSIYGPYEEMISRWLGMDTTITLIALLHGRTAGFVMFGTVEESYGMPAAAEILAIAVEPPMQGRGIGQMLLKEIEKKAAILGEKNISLHTAVGNTAAQKLFNKNSYRPAEMKPNFYPRGQDAILMFKKIE